MSDASPDAVRETVSTAYAQAIARTASAGTATASCCGPSSCAPSSTSSSAAARVGYTAEQLAAVPNDVAASSFGCGSPLAFAGVQPGQTVLDLGSGAGLDLLLAAEAVGPEGRVIGVDMTEAMLARARANVARAGATQVELRQGVIEALPVEDASVDWVISNCVINLSPEKEKVFAEIARVLRPGGTMLVSDIVVEDLPDWLRARSDLFTACVGGAISEADYRAGLAAAGLVDVQVRARLDYGAAEIRAFLDSDELPVSESDAQALSPEVATNIAQALDGKVASLKFAARKP